MLRRPIFKKEIQLTGNGLDLMLPRLALLHKQISFFPLEASFGLLCTHHINQRESGISCTSWFWAREVWVSAAF